MSLQADFLINNYGFKFEFDVCVNVRSIKEGKDIEERVLAHRLVLSSASVRFRGLLAVHLEGSVSSIDIDLRMIPNAVNAFKVMLSALYTGELNYTLAEPSEVLAVARACQVPTIESKVLATSLEINPLAVLIQQQKTPLVTESTPWQTYLQALLALYMQPGMFPNTFASGLAYPALFQTPPTPPAEESGSR
uniref:BTB domain-containing protein n=1 Tax=Heterorhabditis bacteriophora TaxID=37862 RepID=A0A1I7XU92_HETBA